MSAALPPIPLVPGRECGTCEVCCVALTIVEPGLRKPQGLRCPNLVASGGCGIYPDRPVTCREFDCGWRQLKWIKEGLRPDRSDVLVRLSLLPETRKRGVPPAFSVIFTILSQRGLAAEGLAESIAAAIAADVKLFLEVPGPPGYTSGRAPLNAALAGAVRARDKPGLLATLRQCWEQGRVGQREKVVLP